VRFTAEGKAQATLGYRHIMELEERFIDELGDDYEAARKVLERVAEILAEHDVKQTGRVPEAAP
jgi:ribosomal protein S17E